MNSLTDKISVVITVYNEEKNILDCIESARKITQNIMVIDTGSTDTTVSLVKATDVRLIELANKSYVEPYREKAIASAATEWVFLLDADERITSELANEICSVIDSDEKTHYSVPRKNIFAHKWLKHGGWYPDYIIRLIRVKDFVKWPKAIHSTPRIQGEMGYLVNSLEHYFQPNLAFMANKTAIYEDLESDLLYKHGKKVDSKTFFRKFFGELYRRLIKGKGFLDGTHGIIESVYQAFSKTITYIFLYEKYKKSSSL